MTTQAISESLRSSSIKERLSALAYMRQALLKEERDDFFGLAESTILDPDNDCRWQAMIVVGEFIETKPQQVLRIIEQYGRSADRDMRTAVATVLLEHMLEHHFDLTCNCLQEAISTDDDLLRSTLTICRPFGVAKNRWNEIEHLMAK